MINKQFNTYHIPMLHKYDHQFLGTWTTKAKDCTIICEYNNNSYQWVVYYPITHAESNHNTYRKLEKYIHD